MAIVNQICGRTIDETGRDKVPGNNENVQVELSSNPKDIAARNKCPVHLVPPVMIREVAYVLANGAAKYGKWNWRTDPVQLTNYEAAASRHLLAIRDGEDIDPESGLLHWAHVAATAAIAIDARRQGTLIDDRPKV